MKGRGGWNGMSEPEEGLTGMERREGRGSCDYHALAFISSDQTFLLALQHVVRSE